MPNYTLVMSHGQMGSDLCASRVKYTHTHTSVACRMLQDILPAAPPGPGGAHGERVG